MVSSLGIRQPWSQCLKLTRRPTHRFWWRGHNSQLARWTSPKSFPISEEHSKCRQVSIETGYHYLYFTILYDVNMSCIIMYQYPLLSICRFLPWFCKTIPLLYRPQQFKAPQRESWLIRPWKSIYLHDVPQKYALHSQHSCRFFSFDWCYGSIHGNPNSLVRMVLWSLGCASDSSHIKRGI